MQMTTLLITPVQLIASCVRIAEVCLLGEKKLIAYKEHKLMECPDCELNVKVTTPPHQKKKGEGGFHLTLISLLCVQTL